MKDIILKYVLKNLLDFGSVNDKVVLGMVLRDNPDLKKDVPKVLKEISAVVESVSGLSGKEITAKLKKLDSSLLVEKKEKVKGPLKDLPNAIKGKVVVRIAPSPSGPLHIGHAYGTSLNYEYAKMYDGKLIVRIEDTNPENIYSPAYSLIEKDAKWLTENNVYSVVVQSSRVGKYYDYAEELVRKGKAYVCICNADTFRELKAEGKACPCRNLGVKEQHLRYAKMFNEYAEGEAVLRLMTDIKDKNPAMRDFALMRINEHIHPRTKKEHRVWPLMVFSVAIDDHELGVTHVMNGKEHADNGKKEILIMNCFGWESPEYKHWGRINFEGFQVSASKTRIAIEQGEYTGWDDIRLPFLPALRKRGYQPEAFRKYALKVGLSLTDKTVPIEEFWKMVNAFNKEIVEKKANRYFVVLDPKEITVEGGISKKVEMDLHPDFPKRGTRVLNVKNKVLISGGEKLAAGKVHRLIDYCNFKIVSGKFKFVSEDYADYKSSKNKGSIIHWLPSEEKLEVSVMLEDGSVVSGIGESAIGKLKIGSLVQLERMYFARLDSAGKFWYLHQ
jgi:glutamyl-tRNA synthetase